MVQAIGKPNRVFVGNLQWDLTEGEVREIFEAYGKLYKSQPKAIIAHLVSRCELRFVRKPYSGALFCFICYEHEQDAQNAIQSLDETMLRGRKINVKWSHTDMHYTDRRDGHTSRMRQDRHVKGSVAVDIAALVKKHGTFRRLSCENLAASIGRDQLASFAQQAGSV